MAKTLVVHHGSRDRKSDEDCLLTPPKIRKLVQYAKGLGIEPFESTRYKGWIHPFGVSDVFNYAGEEQITGVFIRKLDVKRPTDKSIEICGIEFKEHTAMLSLVIFGENSDPIDVKQCFIGELSTFD